MKQLLFKPYFFLFILLLCFTVSSCADVQTDIKPCLEGHVYGFWGGIWHGLIAPVAWLGSLFSDDIAVWAVNNNGGWYTFGFVLGIGGLSVSSSKASKK